MKTLKVGIDTVLTKVLNGYLDKQINEVQREWLGLKKKYIKVTRKLKDLVINIRSNQVNVNRIGEILLGDDSKTLNDNTTKLINYVEDLKAKGRFIENLQDQNFIYRDVTVCNLTQHDEGCRLAYKISKNNQRCRILCCNDTFKKKQRIEIRSTVSSTVKRRYERSRFVYYLC